jgi:hypothetical protein
MPKNPQGNSNPTLNHEKLKEADRKQNLKPERKEEKKIYAREHNKRPEVKARKKPTTKNTTNDQKS